MLIWSNVNVGIWKYNIMGICIEYPFHDNVDLQKLFFYVIVRSIDNLNK